jgi:hypothetical protein
MPFEAPCIVGRGRIAEAGERRHHHCAGRWPVEGLVAFEDGLDAEIADKGLGSFDCTSPSKDFTVVYLSHVHSAI